ncbi:MAG: ABC transporter substrate-binding protein [Deltaproteobacteria bacterium]|nr:ABC transporter substrate-binding protein [Deltaproteobacteria bacterium]MBW2129363.1 ABC transporter substrate-binding protein [Deltaproteobacteria bacterium]
MEKSMTLKSSLFTFILIAVALLLPWAGTCEAKTYKIGISTIATHPALDTARKGFLDQMAKEGFKEGVNVKYYMANAEGDMSLAASIAQKFVTQKVDLILAITTPIVQACAAAVEGTNIPVVFSCVTDPVAAGVVKSWDKPGGQITGASDWADVAHQVAVIKQVCPNVKRVGTIYNAGEANSRVQIKELKKAAPALGIEEVVEANVASTADVMLTARSLVGRVDAIWFPTDNVVVSALEALVKVCEDNKIPLFGSDTNQVERGVIASSGINFYDVGRESGKMAARILRGESPANIPVSKGKMTDLYVNPSAAKRMGVTIPQSVMEKATKVIDK